MIQKFHIISWLPLVGLLLVLGDGPVWAQQEPDPFLLPGTTDTGNSKLKPLRLRTLQTLEFGRLSTDALLGGSVTIHPATGKKSTFRAQNLGGLHGRAEFEISGEPNTRFVVTLPKKVVIQNPTGKPITLTHFTVHPDKIGILGPDGKTFIQVGATLNLGPGREGSIEGRRTVDIFVDYLP